MDILIRGIAIFVEVLILATVMSSMVTGVKFLLLDLGIGQKYDKIVTMAMVFVAGVSTVFFIAHLTSFYPTP
jgi:hypothetical protein